MNKSNNEFKQKINELSKKIESLTEDNKSNAKQLEEKLRDTEENNEHLMDKLRSASVAYNDLKKAKSESEEETVKAKRRVGTLTSKIDNLEKELKEQQSKK